MNESPRLCKACNSPLSNKETKDVCTACTEKQNSKQLVENVDYYMENGFFVFTEKYHLERGYCCGSGCRHCPY